MAGSPIHDLSGFQNQGQCGLVSVPLGEWIADVDTIAPGTSHLAEQVYKHLQVKSAQARRTGFINFGLTLLVAIGILSAFLYTQPLETVVSMQTQINNGLIKSSAEENITRSLVGMIINSVVVRIGAVLVGIFLIQILVGFSRYYFRLAEHLSGCAEVILLAGGNPTLVKELAPIMLPQHDFAKIPASPLQNAMETAMDTVKELSKKIPIK